jgi:hypothetical protein
MKNRFVLLGAIALMTALVPLSAPAQTRSCRVNCNAPRIQFAPGQSIRLALVNRTDSAIRVGKVLEDDAESIDPGEDLEIGLDPRQEPDIPVVFWSESDQPLRAVLTRRDDATLFVELLPATRPPGDRSLFLRSNGLVGIF